MVTKGSQMNDEVMMKNAPDIYAPCCFKSLMKPVNWKMGIIIYECVRCKFRWQINKCDLEELRLMGENTW